jgi:hypothetical protein
MPDGIVIQNDLTDLSKFDIPFETRSLQTEDGEAMPARFGRAVKRMDTDEIVGRVGPRTTVKGYLSNLETLNHALHDNVDLSGIEVKDAVHFNGGRIHRQIVFPNYKIEPAVGDITQLMLDVHDSVDNSWAWQVTFTGHRLWCLNGCTTKDFSIRMYGRHGARSKIEYSEAMRVIASGINAFQARESEFRTLMKSKIQRSEVENLYRHTIAWQPRRDSKGNRVLTNLKRLDDLMNAYDIERSYSGDNLYSVYNGATRWATHSDTKSPDARRLRHVDVAKMQRTHHWSEKVMA